MARGRHRFKVQLGAGPAKLEWEWIGFHSGAVPGSLDTSIVHEIVPVIADTTVGIQSFTCHRIVGQIQIRQQSGVTTASAVGITIGVEDAGLDQTSDNPFVPLSTDVDHAAHKGQMFRWVGFPVYQTALGDADDVPWNLPIDIKVKRIIDKRQRLVATLTAASTARLRATVNLRTLIRESAGT